MTKTTTTRPAKKQPPSTTSNKVTKTAKAPGRSKAAPVPTEQGSKTSVCLELLRQPDGTTLQELMATTGWQAHSVRGFLSGTVRKKMGLLLVAGKDGDGVRRYQVKVGA